MSIRTVVSRGYGNGTFSGTIPFVVRRGYTGTIAQTTGSFFGGPFFGGGFFDAQTDGPFFGGPFFDGDFFGDAQAAVVVSGGGGLDPGEGFRRRDLPAKPLGLPPRRRTEKKTVDDRVEESSEIQAEVKEEQALASTPASFEPIETMSVSQIHEEIRILLIRQQTKDDEDRLMLLLLAAGS